MCVCVLFTCKYFIVCTWKCVFIFVHLICVLKLVENFSKTFVVQFIHTQLVH